MSRKKAFEEVFINAAIAAVAEVGIENSRTKDIADRSGYTEATLFRHYESKEALLNAVFLSIDERISDLVTESPLAATRCEGNFEIAAYGVWRSVYRYLIEHKDETIFLIRYRYSALYTADVRAMRRICTGDFDGIRAAIGENLQIRDGALCSFLADYVFEATLSFAEKVITGSFRDNVLTEYGAWSTVSVAAKEIVRVGLGGMLAARPAAASGTAINKADAVFQAFGPAGFGQAGEYRQTAGSGNEGD